MKGAFSIVAMLSAAMVATASPLWDYVNAQDDAFKWHPTGFVLNNTGLGWTGESRRSPRTGVVGLLAGGGRWGGSNGPPGRVARPALAPS